MDKPKRKKKAVSQEPSSPKKRAARKPRGSSKKAPLAASAEIPQVHLVVDPKSAQAQEERTVAAPPEPLPELKDSRLTNIAFIAGKTVARFTRKK